MDEVAADRDREGTRVMQKITPLLWFDSYAEEADHLWEKFS